MNTVRDYAIQCIKEEAHATLALIDQLDENFDKAVGLMFHCKGKVIVTGVGKSGNIGAKIAATLSSTGTPDKGRRCTRTLQFGTDRRAIALHSDGFAQQYSHHRNECQPTIAIG